MTSTQTQHSETVDTTPAQYDEHTDATVTQDLPKTPYNDRFVSEYRQFANGNSIPISELTVSGANLYQSALAILAEYDLLTVAGTARSKILLSGYDKTTCTYVINRIEKTIDVSVKSMAQAVVDTYDKYYNMEFMWNTMLRTWRRAPVELKEGQKYDPLSFSKRDRETTLGRAGMTLLVKTFRNCLTETIRRCLNNAPVDKWDSSRASFKYDGRVVQSVDFCDYVDDLLKQYWKIALFTPELTEFRAVTSAVAKLTKQEKEQRLVEYAKKQEENEQKATEAVVTHIDNLNESKVVDTDVSCGGHVKMFSTTSQSRTGNPWTGNHDSSQKNYILEAPVSEHVDTVEQVDTTEQPKKRVISSGKQKSGKNQKWKKVSK